MSKDDNDLYGIVDEVVVEVVPKSRDEVLVPEYGTVERLQFDVKRFVEYVLEMDSNPLYPYPDTFLRAMISFVEPPIEGTRYYESTIIMLVRNIISNMTRMRRR